LVSGESKNKFGQIDLNLSPKENYDVK